MNFPDYPFTPKRFEVRPGIAMSYLDEGPRDAPPVVMVHGNPSWSYYYPKLVLALAFVAALGPGIENAVIAIAITSWPPYARIARAETLTVRNSDYIAAVQLMGASPIRIVFRHVMPMCMSSLIVRVTLDMAGIILTAAGLGFLGLGAQPPLPEWGAMIASGRRFILDQWWVATMPGIAILIVSLGFNLLGDGLRDALDPRESGQ